MYKAETMMSAQPVDATPDAEGLTRPFPLLADPAGYTACGFDLHTDPWMHRYWLDLFRNHFPHLLEEALAEAVDAGGDLGDVRSRCDACARAFNEYLVGLENHTGGEHLDTRVICERREQVLRENGFEDAYRLTKHTENEAALRFLPDVLSKLDRLPEAQRAASVIEGVFAGNIFDLGAAETIKLFKEGVDGTAGIDFYASRKRLKPRPWLEDDLDLWLNRLSQAKPYRCAMIFVDNAGCDIVLGVLPFARDLIARGTRVILAANSAASLNDVTDNELVSLIESIAAWDATLGAAWRDGRLTARASGNGTPLIDLSRCSPALADAATTQRVDLVVLEGMGRALETNFEARFACDVLKIAMVKDRGVARYVGGELYDLVFRYESGTQTKAEFRG